jgi:hypothetical protein
MDSLSRRHDPLPEAHPETASDRWTVPDLIDFDYYVDDDEQGTRNDPAERKRLAERDRRLYLKRIRDVVAKSEPEHSTGHRAAALRRWLGQRRATDDPLLRPLLPGASFARGQRLVTIGLGILSFFLGVGVASTLLRYDGTHPVNVAWYLLVLVLLQILLATTAMGAWTLRRSRPVKTTIEDVSLLSHLIRPVLSRVADWIRRQRLAHLSPEVRDRAKAKAGLLQSHYALYGPASYLPMLIVAQVFGIGFNLGAISATLALEWFSDLAFGWGSALDVQPQTIHDIVRLIALPWSWAFGEGLGYPTLEQIAGSRISLKDPLYVLSAFNLRAWRWFLVLAVVTYGLLPRLVLLWLSLRTQARTLASLPFTHRRAQAVYARMLTPSLETAVAGSGTGPQMPIPEPLQPLAAPAAAPRPRKTPRPAADKPTRAREPSEPPGLPEEDKAPPAAAPAQAESTGGARPAVPRVAEEEPPTTTTTAIAADACVLMIYVDVADLLDESDQARLQQMLLAHTGWRVAASVIIGGGSAMADQAIALIRSGRWEAPPPRIAIVQDGSQPPITEQLRFLRAVRAQAGKEAQVLLALVGDPEGEDALPPVSDFDFSDWQRKIEQMGDPYLRLEILAPAVLDGAASTDRTSK